TANSKLVAEVVELTTVPTFLLSFSCASETLAQTASWDFADLAASLRSFVAMELFELPNVSDCSPPRLLHLPDSTQKAAMGIRPDLGGTMKSIEIIRSWSPPRTMSPDCT